MASFVNPRGEGFELTRVRARWSVSPERVLTEIDGRELSLSNLDKVLYPKTGFTKSQVLDYYARIADVMLPHMKDRPTTLRRYPNGVEGTSFYEKHASEHQPEWIRTVEVPSKSGEHEPIEYTVVGDRPTLLWAANLAALEFHVPLWHVAKGRPIPAPPDYLVFDLDPGPGTSIVECCRVAHWVGERLGRESLFAKTSGSKGLQLYTRVQRTSWERSAERGPRASLKRSNATIPTRSSRRCARAFREGKVLIDLEPEQFIEDDGPPSTRISRATRANGPPTPVTWQEVDACAKSDDPHTLRFEANDVLRRVDEHGDLMAPLIARQRAKSMSRRGS